MKYILQVRNIHDKWQDITIFSSLIQCVDYLKWLEQCGHAPFQKQYKLRLIERK
jgi:hypothetical protein